MTLDTLDIDRDATIAAIDWDAIAPADAKRLRALGLVVGAQVSVAHRGILGGRDPLAVRLGRTVIAVRRTHARAIGLDPQDGSVEGPVDGR